jgi:hypothetical protein
MPCRSAIVRVDQCAEPSPGSACSVSWTTAATVPPVSAKRGRYRLTASGPAPLRRPISWFARPSAAHSNAGAWTTAHRGARSNGPSARAPIAARQSPERTQRSPRHGVTLSRQTVSATDHEVFYAFHERFDVSMALHREHRADCMAGTRKMRARHVHAGIGESIDLCHGDE